MPKITEMFAFVAQDTGPDDEGVMALITPTTAMPLVGADMERVALLIPAAERIKELTGKPYRILHFTLAGELPVPPKPR